MYYYIYTVCKDDTLMKISRSAAMLLALIAERDMGAYEIVKALRALNAERWLPLSESTVYATARLLERQGLIQGRGERTGKAPEKTVFSATANGREALRNAIAEYLELPDASNSEFDLAMVFACAIKRSEALAHLAARRDRLREDIRLVKAECERLSDDPHVRPIGVCMVRHNQYLKESELRTVMELIEIAEGDKKWKWSVTADLGIERGCMQ
jgi:DNA-binding PadR family transcriptional regulator